MLTPRIAASICALCLVGPAAAGAVPASDPPGSHLRHPIPAAAIVAGDTKSDLQNPVLTGSRGDSGMHSAPHALGPATAPTAVPSGSDDNGTNGWEIAAIAEAAVVAACAAAAAFLVSGRRRRVTRVGA
jgi:hypothetical protein